MNSEVKFYEPPVAPSFEHKARYMHETWHFGTNFEHNARYMPFITFIISSYNCAFKEVLYLYIICNFSASHHPHGLSNGTHDNSQKLT